MRLGNWIWRHGYRCPDLCLACFTSLWTPGSVAEVGRWDRAMTERREVWKGRSVWSTGDGGWGTSVTPAGGGCRPVDETGGWIWRSLGSSEDLQLVYPLLSQCFHCVNLFITQTCSFLGSIYTCYLNDSIMPPALIEQNVLPWGVERQRFCHYLRSLEYFLKAELWFKVIKGFFAFSCRFFISFHGSFFSQSLGSF